MSSLSKLVKKVTKTVSKVANSVADVFTYGGYSKLTKSDSYLNDLTKSITGQDYANTMAGLGAGALGTKGLQELTGTTTGDWLSGLKNLIIGDGGDNKGILGSFTSGLSGITSSLGSALSGLSGNIGSLISNLGESVFSAKQAKELYKWQIEQQEKSNVKMFNLENDANLKMWNMQNAYNTPAQQMLRFKEAGLNPNLIYGQTNTASPIATGNLQGGSASYNPEDTIIGRAMALRQQEFGNYVALSNLGMQKTLNDAQAWNIYNTAKNRDRDYELEKRRLELQEKMLPLQLANIDSQIQDRGAGILGHFIGNANANSIYNKIGNWFSRQKWYEKK